MQFLRELVCTRRKPLSVAARRTMDTKNTMYILIFLAIIANTQAAVPGTFFWKPRVGLDIAIPTSYPRTVMKPTWRNIETGMVVLINGYHAALTVAAIAAVMDVTPEPFRHLSPTSAFYYTNMWRWALRHASLIPEWLGGKGNYMHTHKVWKKRFFYMDKFVPHWLRNILFFVDKDEWAQEEREWEFFVRFAEPSFGKHYRYPSKKFNNFLSNRQRETVENMDRTDRMLFFDKKYWSTGAMG